MRRVLKSSQWARVIFFFGGATAALITGMVVSSKITSRKGTAAIVTLPLVLILRLYLAKVTNRPVNINWLEACEQIPQGFVFGCAAIVIENVIAYKLGWVRYEHWGWDGSSVGVVASSVLLSVLEHMAVAICEETVYRGYGFTLFRQAVGLPATLVILPLLFGISHNPKDGYIFLNYTMIGALLTSVRLARGNTYMPIGIHWGANATETGLFGSPAWHPSILPRSISGPERWMGAGYQTGLLTGLVQVGLGALYGIISYLRGRNTRR